MSEVLGNELTSVDDNVGNLITGGSARAAVEYVARSIVDDPEAVVVEAQEEGSGTTLYIHVSPDDKGKIIGKRGRVAMALRTLGRAVGAREGLVISVEIAD